MGRRVRISCQVRGTSPMINRKLGTDTNLIPWPNFFVESLKRRRDFATQMLLVFFVAVAALVMSGQLVFLPVVSICMAVVVSLVADKKLTRPVVVYRKDDDGNVCEDHQKWWVEDAMLWPDESKVDHQGKRVLWIDALNNENPFAFKAWLAPLPSTEIDKNTGGTLIPVTGSRVASVRAKMKSVSRIMKYTEPTAAAQMRTGLLVGALIVGMLAILMAVNRAADIMGFAP